MNRPDSTKNLKFSNSQTGHIGQHGPNGQDCQGGQIDGTATIAKRDKRPIWPKITNWPNWPKSSDRPIWPQSPKWSN